MGPTALLAASLLMAPKLDVEGLRRIVATEHVHSSEQLMAALPADLRSRYLLAYETESRQSATPACPRVILFETDASLLLAFSGYKAGMQCDDGRGPLATGEADRDFVEVIQFREATKTFEFHSLDFSGEQGEAVFDDDPTVCKGCHTPSLRPNWDSYDIWPKFYGSLDDGMAARFPEGQNFAKMVRTNGRRGIYQYLIGLEASRTFLGHANLDHDERYYPLSASKAPYEKILHFSYDYLDTASEPRPNLKFTFELSHLNLDRVAREVATKVSDERTRLLVLDTLLQCDGGSIAKFLPVSERTAYTTRIAADEAGCREQVGAELRAKVARVQELVPPDDADYHLSAADNPEGPIYADCAIYPTLAYLLEPRGVAMIDWGMAFGQRQMNFTTGNRGLLHLLAPFARELALTDPALASLPRDGFRADMPAACAAVEQMLQAH